MHSHNYEIHRSARKSSACPRLSLLGKDVDIQLNSPAHRACLSRTPLEHTNKVPCSSGEETLSPQLHTGEFSSGEWKQRAGRYVAHPPRRCASVSSFRKVASLPQLRITLLTSPLERPAVHAWAPPRSAGPKSSKAPSTDRANRKCAFIDVVR
jgi:hypothetical protein